MKTYLKSLFSCLIQIKKIRAFGVLQSVHQLRKWKGYSPFKLLKFQRLDFHTENLPTPHSASRFFSNLKFSPKKKSPKFSQNFPNKNLPPNKILKTFPPRLKNNFPKKHLLHDFSVDGEHSAPEARKGSRLENSKNYPTNPRGFPRISIYFWWNFWLGPKNHLEGWNSIISG